MTIDKNNEGAWRICENINGYLETQVYYFYTKKDAIRKFREHKKAIINKQKGTMTNKLQEKINDYLKKIIKADDDNEAQNITYDYDVEVLPQEEYDKIEQMMKENK